MYNINDNSKNNILFILLSENIRQKRLTILEYFDAYICHHYQPNVLGQERGLQDQCISIWALVFYNYISNNLPHEKTIIQM